MVALSSSAFYIDPPTFVYLDVTPVKHSSTATPRLRVLVLPGFLQNANIMRLKFEPIQQLLGSHCEFVIVDPPHVSHPPTVSSQHTSAPDPAPGAARTWWWATDFHEGPKCRHFLHFDETLLYLRHTLET